MAFLVLGVKSTRQSRECQAFTARTLDLQRAAALGVIPVGQNRSIKSGRLGNVCI